MQRQPFRDRRLPPWAVTLVVVLAGAAGGCGRSPAPTAAPAPAAAEVMVAVPQAVRVPEYLEVTGRIDAELVVDIRSRITGYLTKVAFRDGEVVAKGDLLYEIDVRPYAAQLAAAMGTVEQLAGQRRFLDVQIERYEKLVTKGAASQQEFDSYKAKLEENAGALAAARAQEEFARLNVEFCSITAPIAGQIGRTQLQVGNLINQDQTTLTTIVSIDPIFVYFNVDEPTLVRMMTQARESASGIGTRAHQAVVSVGLVDDVARAYPHQSRVDFLNNQLDAKTATITMRGRLDNPHSDEPTAPRPPLFRPGMFARVRLPLGDAVERLVVPEAAVGSNQDRKILWVVGPDDLVTAREVTIGQKLGTWIAVAATDPATPLAATDRIVVRGLQRCREGKPVRPVAAAEDSLDRAGLVVPPPRPEPPARSPDPAPSAAIPSSPPPDPPRSATAEPLPAPGEAAP
ncbi:MAG: efflux RND transporter periplasmic adaptor subunit [Pirellulales bacterium]|jgi:RND family efflux transporter MFP subunit